MAFYASFSILLFIFYFFENDFFFENVLFIF